jgi:hypothetical protein
MTEWEPESHENDLRRRMVHLNKQRKAMMEITSHDAQLERHYGLGKRHPDDVTVPLNEWDSTDD